MNTYSAILPHIECNDYETHFWNAMRGKKASAENLKKGVDHTTGAFILTPKGQKKYNAALKDASLFRNLATNMKVYDHGARIKTANSTDVAVWVAEGGVIPITDALADFGEITLKKHKLAVFFTLENDFINDAFFNVEDYIVDRLAKNFGRAEDDGFINGNGENAPTGILVDDGGAEVGVTTKALTYDDVVKLFFSVKPEYRKNGVWLMNDETALALRTLKDADGNYIWNHANDTILGKRVCISEFMPGIESGSKPIAFGDFSYYWIVCRRPVSVRTLVEQFAMMDCIGYMGYEFLDGRLVRPEAIKVIQMTA